MRALGIGRLILLTGDRAAAAREVGDALGMDEVVAEVLPAVRLTRKRRQQALEAASSASSPHVSGGLSPTITAACSRAFLQIRPLLDRGPAVRGDQ